MSELKQVANSTLVVLFARIILPAILTVATPIVGFLIMRAVNTVDAQSVKLDVLKDGISQHTGSLAIITSKMDDWQRGANAQQTEIKAVLSDHETRIRTLERPAFIPH